MKLIIQNDRIAATAMDEYVGPETWMHEPPGFDISRLADYVLVDGALVIPVPQEVTVLQALLAIDQAGMSLAYDAWANDPARTFAEKAFINYAAVWERHDPLMIAGATALGLNQAQLDGLFTIAATL